MNKIYIYIDVNNAFLSWEAVDRVKKGAKVDLRNIPSAVAGDPKKRTGIILAKSKPAKDKGVVTGEPIYSAMKKCPNLAFVPPNFNLYENQHKGLEGILNKYSDKVKAFSIDEFCIEYIPLFGSFMDVAYKIQKEVFDSLGFTVNIGISENLLLAKMASDFEKPNRVHTLFKNEIESKMWPLTVESLFLLGRQSAKVLRSIGIDTIGKLATADVKLLQQHLKSQGLMLKNYANGIYTSNTLDEVYIPKSVGHSKTSVHDLKNKEEIYAFILDIVNDTCIRLRELNMKAKNISISIKTSNFKVYSTSSTLDYGTDLTKEIYNICLKLFDNIYKGEPVRLIGVSLSSLTSSNCSQLNIFDNVNKKYTDLDRTVDNILSKFDNKNIITRASLIKRSNS